MPTSSEVETFWRAAYASTAGIAVTVFPTRDGKYRARAVVDGKWVYSPDYETLHGALIQLGLAAIRSRGEDA